MARKHRTGSPKRDRSTKSKALDEKLERFIIEAMPGLPQECRRIGRKAERFDIRRPATLKAEIERDFASFAKKLNFKKPHVVLNMKQLF